MPEVAQEEYSAIFVEYARKKLETDRLVVEYLSLFGDMSEKSQALLVLAAGETNGK